MTLLRARQLEACDFQRFDLLLAMDRGHLEIMQRKAPPVYRNRLKMFLSYAPATGYEDVPDPYYGGGAGFETVLDLCEHAVDGLLASWMSQAA